MARKFILVNVRLQPAVYYWLLSKVEKGEFPNLSEAIRYYLYSLRQKEFEEMQERERFSKYFSTG